MKIIDIGILDEPTSGWELDMDKFAKLYLTSTRIIWPSSIQRIQRIMNTTIL